MRTMCCCRTTYNRVHLFFCTPPRKCTCTDCRDSIRICHSTYYMSSALLNLPILSHLAQYTQTARDVGNPMLSPEFREENGRLPGRGDKPGRSKTRLLLPGKLPELCLQKKRSWRRGGEFWNKRRLGGKRSVWKKRIWRKCCVKTKNWRRSARPQQRRERERRARRLRSGNECPRAKLWTLEPGSVR